MTSIVSAVCLHKSQFRQRFSAVRSAPVLSSAPGLIRIFVGFKTKTHVRMQKNGVRSNLRRVASTSMDFELKDAVDRMTRKILIMR